MDIEFEPTKKRDPLAYPNAFQRKGFKTLLHSEMIRARNIKGHNSYFIYGKKGVGKSTYALLNLFSVYQDWEKALKHLCFLREEVLNVISEAYDLSTGKIKHRIPLLVWDDATFENMKSRSYDPFIDEFAKFYTVIRSVVSNFMWTGPAFGSLPNKLRDLDWTIIRVTRHADEATAYFYNWNTSPKGQFFTPRTTSSAQKIREKYRFSWIPQDVREIYENKRDSYSLEGLKRAREAMLFSQHMKATEKRIARVIDKEIRKPLDEKK